MNKKSMEQSLSPLEVRLEHIANNFPYPPTPNIAGEVEQQLVTKPAQPSLPSRRLTWGVMVAAAAIVILLALPPVRTVVFEAVRQGVVRIFLLEPLPTATPFLTITPAAPAELPTGAGPQSSIATPRPPATPIASILKLSRKMILTKPQLQVTAPPTTKSPRLTSPDGVLGLKTNLRFKVPSSAIERKLCYNGAY